MVSTLDFDKVLIAFKIQKLEKGKYLIYGLSPDLVRQGDYVNIYSLCSEEKILCGFVRRIYYGGLANTELALSLPGEEHSFLIIKDEIYYRQNPVALQNYKSLLEAESSGLINVILDFISKAKSILKEKGKTKSAKFSEIRKAASEAFQKIRDLKVPQSIKNKFIEKVKKLLSFFTRENQDKTAETPPKT